MEAPQVQKTLDRRVIFISTVALATALLAGVLAQALIALIGLITNIAYYGKISLAFSPPSTALLGPLSIFIPIIGALIVGLMAYYGSPAIRGHGIPEAMEQVLLNQSRVPPRVLFLKPISAAISIGTGGPFGAEGPIIATGGSLGSLFGQLLTTTALERKTLLAAGAAAGMAATFGSPVSAVLLAVELLLFEFRARSIIPVSLAAVAATGVRYAFVGSAAIFPTTGLSQPSGEALSIYLVLGAVVGVFSVYVTQILYAVEDVFDHLPVHWMWWPAIGAVAVGVVGYIEPLTLGVGYSNIEHILHGDFTTKAVVLLCFLKFLSWSISLGSGTSGGTLAPLFTIGGGLGYALAALSATLMPSLGIDPRMGALVGMAAMFAGASRALLASAVFAFETTLNPVGLLPLLGGCTAAFLVSHLMMRNTIMTEKIARRGIKVPHEYLPDPFEGLVVGDVALRNVVTLLASESLEKVREWLQSNATGVEHQGYPVLDSENRLLGVVTRRDLMKPTADLTQPIAKLIQRPAVVVYADTSLRDAVAHMLRAGVGRMPVLKGPIDENSPVKLIGILTRSDLIAVHRRRMEESIETHRGIRLPVPITFRRG